MSHADEPRDPRLRARLEVEPLDDVTRARLVRTAVEAQERPGRRPVILGEAAIAAILAVVVVVAFAVVGGDGSEPTALRSKSHGNTARDSRRTPAEAAPSPAAAGPDGAALPSLGFIGDVGDRRATRAAIAGATPGAAGSPAACAVARAGSLGTPVAAATGTLRGAPVTVVVVENAAGRRRAIVVTDACAVAARFAL
jgi:hypothetical protein